MKTAILSLLLSLNFASPAFAGQVPNHCEAVSWWLGGDKPAITLGRFDADTTEDQETLLSFFVPEASLYAVAGVLFSEGDVLLSVSLEKTAAGASYDPTNGAFAQAKISSDSASKNTVSVTTLLRLKNRLLAVQVKCQE